MDAIDLNAVGMGKVMLSDIEMDVADYLGDVDDALDQLTLAVTSGDLSLIGPDGIDKNGNTAKLQNMNEDRLRMNLDPATGKFTGWCADGNVTDVPIMDSTIGQEFVKALKDFMSAHPNLTDAELGQIKDFLAKYASFSGDGDENIPIPPFEVRDADGNVIFTFSSTGKNGEGWTQADFNTIHHQGLFNEKGEGWVPTGYAGFDPASTGGMYVVSAKTDEYSKMASVVTKAIKTMMDIAKQFAQSLQ